METNTNTAGVFSGGSNAAKNARAMKTVSGRDRNVVALDEIRLPWPPSINHYWRFNGRRVFVNKEGQAYRAKAYLAAVRSNAVAWPKEARLLVQVVVIPGDNRRRDLDNLLKCLLDSLTMAGVWHDDSQIDRLEVSRGEVEIGAPRVVVRIREIQKGNF